MLRTILGRWSHVFYLKTYLFSLRRFSSSTNEVTTHVKRILCGIFLLQCTVMSRSVRSRAASTVRYQLSCSLYHFIITSNTTTEPLAGYVIHGLGCPTQKMLRYPPFFSSTLVCGIAYLVVYPHFHFCALVNRLVPGALRRPLSLVTAVPHRTQNVLYLSGAGARTY